MNNRQPTTDHEQRKRIFLAGGSTGGGPVMPLLALAKTLARELPVCEFLWLGSSLPLERKLVAHAGIAYRAIPSGKLRRYVAWENVMDIACVIGGFFSAVALISRYRPKLMVTAGGFSGPPVALACWLFHIPVHVHQQDVIPGLANRLMAPFAASVSVTVAASQRYFSPRKTTVTGAVVRADVLYGDASRFFRSLGIDTHKPVVIVLGGGQGAIALNRLVEQSLVYMSPDVHIAHVTGYGKRLTPTRRRGYTQKEFVGADLPDWYAAADIVVTRAGFATLAELAALRKTVVVVPMPRSHQEANAAYFADRQGVRVLAETADPKIFAENITNLLADAQARKRLGDALYTSLPPSGLAALTPLILSYAKR